MIQNKQQKEVMERRRKGVWGIELESSSSSQGRFQKGVGCEEVWDDVTVTKE